MQANLPYLQKRFKIEPEYLVIILQQEKLKLLEASSPSVLSTFCVFNFNNDL
jgi:hypothetical protein